MIGKTINKRYHVEGSFGRGGMADVYKVWDKQRAVYLAMKVLRQDLAQDPIFLRRFQREAKALAQLQHPPHRPFLWPRAGRSARLPPDGIYRWRQPAGGDPA